MRLAPTQCLQLNIFPFQDLKIKFEPRPNGLQSGTTDREFYIKLKNIKLDFALLRGIIFKSFLGPGLNKENT